MPFHSLLFSGQICFLLTGAYWAPPLPCHAQSSPLGNPPRTMLSWRCCRLPLLTGGYRPELRLPLFFHSQLLFLELGWLSKSYWMLCRVGALSCTVYVGNCVHCSGLISWCLHFSFFSDRVNGMVWEWGGEGSCTSQCSLRCIMEGSFPAQGEREPVKVLVRQPFRLNQ